MDGFTRPQEPSWLKKNRASYEKYFTRIKKWKLTLLDSGKITRKRTKLNKESISKKLKTELAGATDNRCSFCGARLRKSNWSIDHFWPKGELKKNHPLHVSLSLEEKRKRAFSWVNLYLSCNSCNQSKDSIPPENVIRPDDSDFSFSKYFELNENGEIKPRKLIEKGKKEMSEATIEIFDLNGPEITYARYMSLTNWNVKKKLMRFSNSEVRDLGAMLLLDFQFIKSHFPYSTEENKSKMKEFIFNK